jgi:hypothetical protein
MSKHVDDLARRRAPRNGVGLSGHAMYNVMCIVKDLVDGMHRAAQQLAELHDRRGSRAWRRECMTVAQRREVKAATKILRTQAKRWSR